MPQKARNIALALAVLFILPASLLTFRELRSLSQFESTLGALYQRQLDAVLYSVNQYSQDLTDSWIKKLDQMEKPNPSFFQNTPSISQIFIADSIGASRINAYGPKRLLSDEVITLFFEEQSTTIQRLAGYLASNYRKLEPVSVPSEPPLPGILFLTTSNWGNIQPALIILDPVSFASTDLRPRLDLLAQEDFDLFVWEQGAEKPICATDTVSEINIIEQKSLWLLPNYNIAINLRGENLSTLVSERSNGSLGIMLGLNFLVLVGVFLVFRSIKKEIQLAQTKSDFVSNVSHEIRTPLALISMFAETLMLKRVPSEERKDTYYRIIFQESKRLTGLVNKILNFSQMEVGQRAYQFESINLNELVEEIWEAYEFHLKNQGFNAHIELPDQVTTIQADKESISETIINLLDNAMKYSPKVKEITLKTGKEKDEVWLEVSDKGMGIPRDQLDKIFEKFHRVASGPIHNTKGTGLGLSLVKQIMDAHQGRVEVSSILDKGSTFRIFFPQQSNLQASRHDTNS